MKVLRGDAEVARQIQPKDQNHLSDASEDIVMAMSGLIESMFGYNTDFAVVVSGLMLDYKLGAGNTIQFSVSAGQILFNNHLYYIPEIPTTTATVVGGGSKLDYVQNNLYIGLPNNPVVVAPSPVKDPMTLTPTINVHYNYIGSLVFEQIPVADNVFDFVSKANPNRDPIRRIPLVTNNSSGVLP